MFKPSFLAISRLFIVLIGMIKAGYSLMIFLNYNFLIFSEESSNFYKYLVTFFVGSILAFPLYKNLSRNFILLFAESLYILMMIIIPFSSNDFRIYGFLLSGGFCFLLYPIYSNENLLKADQKKSTIIAWIFMGLGIIYYFWLTYHYQLKENFQWKIAGALSVLKSTDNITPYVFGTFSVLNVLLILLQKGKETIQFYKLKQDKQKIIEISDLLYSDFYSNKVKNEFNINIIESTSSLLLYGIYNNNEMNRQDKQKLLIQMFSLSFFIGSQGPMSNLIDTVMNYLYLLQGDTDYLNLKINFGGLGSFVFTEPFQVLKIHEIIIYFMFFWIGNIAQYAFIHNSLTENGIELMYCPQILSIITLLLVILSFLLYS
ncbi:transmembrane protein, putative (macronuclear) [Tetrahymena thermophila SB210]|uniref:Transmembrane protein, putative n=1 Tax=Tetrahymena thermophila (strain SB210) TaxID=312017 RepID=I7LUI7_TETTS|nr:transmembrane protein, putative [Tetrahymena thermophila SB210]EAR93852.2 transmembrane protein, putative [Tetrahymena thermophila SB210]|eukprot:XP_001014097.2 transmembrane protein, putative [Tetrahymena thermophila SB210]